MLQSISTKSAGLLAVLAFACMATMPFSAAAETEVATQYTEEQAVEALALAVEAVDQAEAAVEAEETDRGDLITYAQEYLASAEEAFAEEDYNGTYTWAEKAENKAEYILAGEAEKTTSEKKEETYEEKDKVESDAKESGVDKYKDYGSSTDYAELESQLQELLQLLIQLLTLQLAQQTAS